MDKAGEVAVGVGAVGEIDHGADQRDTSRVDTPVGSQHAADRFEGAFGLPVQARGDVGERRLAHLTQLGLEVLVLAQPEAQGALADLGFAGGGDDGSRLEQGLERAVLARGEAVETVPLVFVVSGN